MCLYFCSVLNLLPLSSTPFATSSFNAITPSFKPTLILQTQKRNKNLQNYENYS
ncbi:hypothetical protein Hanom_Chr01g00050401 [Helianthus anomalus]